MLLGCMVTADSQQNLTQLNNFHSVNTVTLSLAPWSPLALYLVPAAGRLRQPEPCRACSCKRVKLSKKHAPCVAQCGHSVPHPIFTGWVARLKFLLHSTHMNSVAQLVWHSWMPLGWAKCSTQHLCNVISALNLSLMLGGSCCTEFSHSITGVLARHCAV